MQKTLTASPSNILVPKYLCTKCGNFQNLKKERLCQSQDANELLETGGRKRVLDD